MAYSTDEDLQMFRGDILNLGVDSWSEQIAIADGQINRYLDTNWYRKVAHEHGINWRNEDYAFDPANLDNANQVKLASIYLSLSLVYGVLAKNSKDDGFLFQADHYNNMYNKEIKAVVLYGIDYDWPALGERVADRKRPRRLVRG